MYPGADSPLWQLLTRRLTTGQRREVPWWEMQRFGLDPLTMFPRFPDGRGMWTQRALISAFQSLVVTTSLSSSGEPEML